MGILTMWYYSAQINNGQSSWVTGMPALLYSVCDITCSHIHAVSCPTQQKWFSCFTCFYWLVAPNFLFYSGRLAVFYCTVFTVILLNVYGLVPNCSSFSSYHLHTCSNFQVKHLSVCTADVHDFSFILHLQVCGYQQAQY